MKDKRAGSRLVLTTKVEGVDLVAMGYSKYNKRKVIYFITAAKAASTSDGDDPYTQ
jgi:hypothetical protein